MLDTVIGPIIRVIDSTSFQMHVTHIGRYNNYPYGSYETIYIMPRQTTPNDVPLSNALIGRRVKCLIQYRDNFNRLVANVEFEQ